MSDNQTLNTPTAIAPISQGSSLSVNDDWSDSEELEQRLVILSKEVRRLYTWLGFLAGFSLILVGTLGGWAIWLKLQQHQLVRQVSSLTAGKAETEQVKRLEAQVSLLNQKVPEELSSQLNGTQEQLKKLQTRVEQVNTKAVTSEQVNKNLLNALRDFSKDKSNSSSN